MRSVMGMLVGVEPVTIGMGVLVLVLGVAMLVEMARVALVVVTAMTVSVFFPAGVMIMMPVACKNST